MQENLCGGLFYNDRSWLQYTLLLWPFLHGVHPQVQLRTMAKRAESRDTANHGRGTAHACYVAWRSTGTLFDCRL